MHGCSHEGIPQVRAGAVPPALVPVLSQTVIMELLPSTPVVLVTELCINLTQSLNPDIYKYVRNTNMLQEYNLSLLYVPKRKICFVPVLDTPDQVLEVR